MEKAFFCLIKNTRERLLQKLLVGFPLLVHFLIGQTLAWGWGREGQDLGLNFCCCLNFISWKRICQGRKEEELWERNKTRRTKRFFARLGNNFLKNSWKMWRQNIADLIILEWGANSYYEYCQHVAFCNYFSNATNPAINTFHPWYPAEIPRIIFAENLPEKCAKRNHLVFQVETVFFEISTSFPTFSLAIFYYCKMDILLINLFWQRNHILAQAIIWKIKKNIRWPFLPEAFLLDPGVGDEKKGRKLLLPPPFTLSKRRRQRMRNKEQTLFKDLRRGLVLK